jgi:hypothetical protein
VVQVGDKTTQRREEARKLRERVVGGCDKVSDMEASKWIAAGLLSLMAAVAPVAINAANRHPVYQRSRNDLRLAQFLMRVPEDPTLMKNLSAADAELALAVAEIDKAAILDHRNLLDAPPLDQNPDRLHRFEKIVSLMRSARTDMTRQEDNEKARVNRDAAGHHIDLALEDMHKVAADMHWEKELHF